MTAAYLIGNRGVEVREAPDPIPGPDDVILAMKASGLCGSDFRIYRNQPSANAGNPKIAGHEPCGEVSEVGSNVKGLAVGDRVMMHHYTGCGSCTQCRVGYIVLIGGIDFKFVFKISFKTDFYTSELVTYGSEFVLM